MARRLTAMYAQKEAFDRVKALADGNLRAAYSRNNMAAYEAQKCAPEMVQFLADVVRDPTQEIRLRVECAEKVLNRAYGVVANTLAPPNPMEPGGPEMAALESDIGEAEQALDRLALLQQWMPRPIIEWPQTVLDIGTEAGVVTWVETPDGLGKKIPALIEG